MKIILFFMCLFFFLSHTSCYAPKENLYSNSRPCVVVPDSLKIKNHKESSISFLYKKEDGNLKLFSAKVESYFDISKKNELIFFDYRTDWQDKQHQNTYLNPIWLKKVFFEYYARHTDLFLETEARQLERHRQAKTELILFGFGVYTCSSVKRKRR